MTSNRDADPTFRDHDKIRQVVDKVFSRNIEGLKPLEGLELDLGSTPKDIIYTRGTLKLYRYRPVCEELYRVPIVLVMSLVSRYYILDLTPGQSLVEYLVRQGFDVYLLDWGVPRAEHSHLRLDDYVDDLLPDCLDKVARDCGETQVSLAGYCLGGTLACMYTALNPGGAVKNLACFTTPANAAGMTLYKAWADNENFDIDEIVDRLGNIPAALIDAALQALRPLQRTAGRLKLLDHVSDDEFVKAHYRFERWSTDQIPMAGETARQLFKDFLRDNKLVRNELEINGKKVNFGNITVPFLHVAAQHDHIVPTAASADLVSLVASKDKREIVLKGGHVSLVAGGNAIYRLWPQLSEWLGEKSV